MSEQPTILVIDDEEAMRDSCTQALTKDGYLTETAKNGDSGLEKVNQRIAKRYIGNSFIKISVLIFTKYFPNTSNDESFEGPQCGLFSDLFCQRINSSQRSLRLGGEYSSEKNPFRVTIQATPFREVVD